MLLHTNRRFNIGDMKFKIQIGLSWLKAELHHIYIIHQYIDKSYKSWSKSSTWVYSRFLVWSVLLIEHLGSPPGFGGVRVAHRAPGFTPGFLVGSVLLIEHLSSPPGFGGVRVAHRAPVFTPSLWCGPCSSSSTWVHPRVFGGIRIAHRAPEFTPGFWWGPCCSSFLLFCVALFCLSLFCLSLFCVLCTQCCQCHWIVHSWFPIRFSLTFICNGPKHVVWTIFYCHDISHYSTYY